MQTGVPIHEDYWDRMYLYNGTTMNRFRPAREIGYFFLISMNNWKPDYNIHYEMYIGTKLSSTYRVIPMGLLPTAHYGIISALDKLMGGILVERVLLAKHSRQRSSPQYCTRHSDT
jgi:hypothetical protein